MPFGRYNKQKTMTLKEMTRFLMDMATAIKYGLLRISPKPSLYLGILTALIMIGCCTQKKVTEVIREVRNDTFCNNNYKHDSVYVGHERMVDSRHDTVFITDLTIEYRYKVVCDTVRIVKCDTIPFVQKVEVTKKEPYVPMLYKLSTVVLSIIIISIILYLIWRKLF